MPGVLLLNVAESSFFVFGLLGLAPCMSFVGCFISSFALACVRGFSVAVFTEAALVIGSSWPRLEVPGRAQGLCC